MPFISAIKGYPSLLISNIFFCTSLSLFGGTSLCPPNLRLSIYKHRSAMNQPTKAACLSGACRPSVPRQFSLNTLYIRERVPRSLESPLPLCTYRIAYFPQKNNRQDIRIPAICFMLIYKLFLFVLYVLTNRFIVCYNNGVVGDPTEQYRRTFLCKGYLNRFTGFGIFESRKRPARTGHDPATGARSASRPSRPARHLMML